MGLSLDDVYEAKWLKAADLKGEARTVTIAAIGETTFTDRTTKEDKKQITLTFQGVKKPLGLNWTNAKKVSEICGSRQTDDWVGQQIVIFPIDVEAFGEITEAIRIKPVAVRGPKSLNQAVSEFEGEVMDRGRPAEIDEDDSIPW